MNSILIDWQTASVTQSVSVTHKHHINDFIKMKVQEIKVFAATKCCFTAATYELFLQNILGVLEHPKFLKHILIFPHLCWCTKTYWWQVNLIPGSISENGRKHSFNSLNVCCELSNVQPEWNYYDLFFMIFLTCTSSPRCPQTRALSRAPPSSPRAE